MKTIKYILTIISMVTALSVSAQTLTEQPNVQFQSTSTLQGSGSTYSANPSLNADGMAVYNASDVAQAPSGPRRIGPTHAEEGDNPNPVGDAVLPLMLMQNVSLFMVE